MYAVAARYWVGGEVKEPGYVVRPSINPEAIQ